VDGRLRWEGRCFPYERRDVGLFVWGRKVFVQFWGRRVGLDGSFPFVGVGSEDGSDSVPGSSF